MARLENTIQTTKGRTRMRNESFKNVTYLIEMRNKYRSEGNDTKCLEIIAMMLPYQLPKLQAIEVSADESNVIKLLTDLRNESMRLKVTEPEPRQLKEGKSETDNTASASGTS